MITPINDGRVYVWLPKELTATKLDDAAVAKLNEANIGSGKPTAVKGETNPVVNEVKLDAGGVDFNFDGNVARYAPFADMTIETMIRIVKLGGEVEGQQVFFALADAELATDVPATFPERLDRDGKPLTWQTWGTFEKSHVPIKLGGVWYRSSCVGESGLPLLASQWVGQVATVLSVAQYQTIQRANAVPIG